MVTPIPTDIFRGHEAAQRYCGANDQEPHIGIRLGTGPRLATGIRTWVDLVALADEAAAVHSQIDALCSRTRSRGC